MFFVNDWRFDFMSVIKCDKGTFSKEGVVHGYWKPKLRIEGGENVEKVIGEEFSWGFFNTKAPGILKGQARVVNGGQPPESLAEAGEAFCSSVGFVLRVKVSTNDKGYTNCYAQEVIVTEDPADVDAEPPQESGAENTEA